MMCVQIVAQSASKCKYLLASLLPDRDELLRLHGTVCKVDSIGPDAQGRHLRKEYVPSEFQRLPCVIMCAGFFARFARIHQKDPKLPD